MHYTFAILFSSLVFVSNAQDFTGYRTSRYAGVNGVFTNPANIARSGYRFDINLFSISATIASDQTKFNLSDLGKIGNGDTLLNRFFPRNNSRSSSTASVAAIAPSVMININDKSAFAVTIRSRVMGNAIDIDNKLARQIISELDESSSAYPYKISSANNMIATANAWTEYGASYARIVQPDKQHIIKLGITLKYLAGVTNTYFSLNNLNINVNQDLLRNPYLTNSTGAIGLGFGGENAEDFTAGDLLKFKGSGFGGDVGVVYEWHKENASADDYVLKAGIAITDIGSIKYNRDQARSGAFTMNISGTQRFYLNEISGTDIQDVKAALRRYPQYFTENAAVNTASYIVSLPSTLQLQADYYFLDFIYLNASGQIALAKTSSNGYNSQYYNAFSLTPRYESYKYGIYLPLAYNSLSKFNAGFGLRAGPFFIGSGSIFSALFKSSRQVDVQAGLRVYGWAAGARRIKFKVPYKQK